mmetsp:Transcript_114434/g.318603  ORF Transcript_114434/g.318603 Transcript_114434/m.318603 type:complete len:243 (-) Transcript_114434:60-788(-)
MEGCGNAMCVPSGSDTELPLQASELLGSSERAGEEQHACGNSDVEAPFKASSETLTTRTRTLRYLIALSAVIGLAVLAWLAKQKQGPLDSGTLDMVGLKAQVILPSGQIRSLLSNHCLDWGSVLVKAKDCDASQEHQQWKYEEGQRITAKSGSCLDHGGANVHVWKCSPSRPGPVRANQNWRWDPLTCQIRGLENMCLAIDEQKHSVKMEPCKVLDQGQMWGFYDESSPTWPTNTAVHNYKF